MARNSRPISWIRAARKDFEDFPQGAQLEMARALTILAEGRMPDIAKPLAGFGSGVMELALRYRGDAFRVVYALRIDDDIWVIHAFQKKSRTGISTPKPEIDLIRERLLPTARVLDSCRGAEGARRRCGEPRRRSRRPALEGRRRLNTSGQTYLTVGMERLKERL